MVPSSGDCFCTFLDSGKYCIIQVIRVHPVLCTVCFCSSDTSVTLHVLRRLYFVITIRILALIKRASAATCLHNQLPLVDVFPTYVDFNFSFQLNQHTNRIFFVNHNRKDECSNAFVPKTVIYLV